MFLKANINLELDQLAEILSSLSESDLEMLELKISNQSKELISRFNDTKNNNVKLLSTEEVFKDFKLNSLPSKVQKRY
jgi:flagellin-like hook-associated protein FlgL